MNCAYLSHPACGEHEPGPYHPERPQRLGAVRDRLIAEGLLDLLDKPAVAPVALDQINRIHDPAYVRDIAAASPRRGRVSLDPDTAMSPGSLDATLAACGATVAAVDYVMAGDGPSRAFCNIRPPGHHAERDRAMGFCLFNAVALSAFHALDAYQLDRVAVLDFDVHHGNGTEDIIRGEKRLCYASSFQHPLFPYSSLAQEPGHIVKTPLDAGTDGDGFRRTITRDWLDLLARWQPQLVIFSAGFDAHSADPLASLELTAGDFAWVTGAVIDAVGPDVPVTSVLEGGYDLDALGESAAAHVRVLAGL